MKKILLILAALVLTFKVSAFYSHTHVRGYRQGDNARRLKPAGASDKIVNAQKKSLAIATNKIEFVEGTKFRTIPIALNARIASLCGYEFGTIAKVGWNTVLDNEGNIVVTEKLKKPFRACTHVELKYSKINHALYSIRVFSPAQRKMDDDAAWKEVKGITDAVNAKFGVKIRSWIQSNQNNTKRCNAIMDNFALQTLVVSAYKEAVDKRLVLQGPSGPELGWAFSLTLTDTAMKNFVPDTEEEVNAAPIQGVDAL